MSAGGSSNKGGYPTIHHFKSVENEGRIIAVNSDGVEEEVKEDDMMMDLFSPINLMRVEKGRGGLRISGTHGGNSESGHSVSGGSFSGSGQKGTDGGQKRIKSIKSNHTIEKTYSDFFNLT